MDFLRSAALLLLCASRGFIRYGVNDAPIVDLGYAKYHGMVNTTLNVTTFLGVRYAAPPIGRGTFTPIRITDRMWATLQGTFASERPRLQLESMGCNKQLEHLLLVSDLQRDLHSSILLKIASRRPQLHLRIAYSSSGFLSYNFVRDVELPSQIVYSHRAIQLSSCRQ